MKCAICRKIIIEGRRDAKNRHTHYECFGIEVTVCRNHSKSDVTEWLICKIEADKEKIIQEVLKEIGDNQNK